MLWYRNMRIDLRFLHVFGRGMPPKRRRREGLRRDRKGKRPRLQGEEGGSGYERGAGYVEVVKENALFEKYYQGLELIPSGEWAQFFSTMQEPLPATFRITGGRRLAESVLGCLERKFFSELANLEVEGEKIPPPCPLPWYPDRLAWQVNLTKKFIRRSPLVSSFHSFLVKENEQGNISRQEAVSMIPPLLLDVRPHHKVLDMCAAPGSKTAQLIEALHAEDTDESRMPSGVVVANDADNKRCYMLVHQAKRLNSPCFMVTNHDASVYPMLYYHNDDDVRLPLYYDRVLCDVPCSGDGTMRKNPTIWRRWSPSLALGLHKLQLRILSRGLELLSPGGCLVYSTCSLNPVENEAVVAAALVMCKGSAQLVACSDMLEGLRSQPGLTSWKLMTKTSEWLSSPADVPQSFSQLIAPSMFPPSPEDVENLQLTRCMRVLPHHQDTGGFFIAVLRKLDWLPWQSKRKHTSALQCARPGCGDPVVPSSSGLQTSPGLCREHQKIECTTQDTTDMAQDTDDTANTAQDTTNPTQDTTNLTQDTTSATQDTDSTTQDTTSSTETANILKAVATESSSTISLDTVSDPSTRPQPLADAEVATNNSPTPKNGSQEISQDSVSNKDRSARPSSSVVDRPAFQRPNSRGYKEDPYVFLEKDSDVCTEIRPYFGLPESFPVSQLLTRTFVGKKRNIYLASKLVKELTKRNDTSVKIINTGIKVLSRCDHPKTACRFRLTQEGIETMAAYVTSHNISVGIEDVVLLLKEPNPLTSALSPSTVAALRSLGWVAAKSVRLYVDKKYRYHFLAILGYDPPENQSLEPVSARGKDDDVESGEEEAPVPKDGDETMDSQEMKEEQTMSS